MVTSRAIGAASVVLLCLLALPGCEKKRDARRDGGAGPSASEVQMLNTAPPGPAEKARAERKIVQTHSIHIEVAEFERAFEAVIAVAEANGGFNVEVSRQKGYDDTRRARIAMRLPAKSVFRALGSLRLLGEVLREESRGDDVTEQYVDLEARLRNARASEQRLLELFKQSLKVSDVVDVERELTRVRGDIESMEARKRAMDLDTTMTTLVIELSEPHKAIPTGKRVWEPIRTAFGDSLEVLAHSVRYAVFTVIALLPWVPLLGLLIYARRRLKRKSRQKGTGALEEGRG